MKAFGLFLLLLSANCFASLAMDTGTPTVKTYVCNMYTDNEVDRQGKFLTDNPIHVGNTVVQQSKTSFTIKSGILFDKDVVLGNPQNDSITGYGSNEQAVLYKQYNEKGGAYFVVYLFDAASKPKASINRALVVAQCAYN